MNVQDRKYGIFNGQIGVGAGGAKHAAILLAVSAVVYTHQDLV
jgi:hypothetical protein